MRLAVVDLSRQRFASVCVGREATDWYLGGRGLGARILFDLVPKNTDPLSEGNALIFLASELVGTGIPGAVKTCAVTKSPLSGTILMSLAGGDFGFRLRSAGFEGLVVTGKSKAPCFLVVERGEVRFGDAGALWGLTAEESSRAILQGRSRAQAVCVGPAAERGILFASAMSAGHAFGRGGVGAVMASKNLKAIVAVAGAAGGLRVADRDRFHALVAKAAVKVAQSPRLARFGRYGTAGNIAVVNERGLLPTRNYRSTQFESADLIFGDVLQPLIRRRFGCPGCPVRCRKRVEVTDGPYAGAAADGPEYETIWAFGAHCGNDRIDSIIAAASLCNSLGIDTISMGNVIGFIMDCIERNLLTSHEVAVANPSFGSHEAILELVRLTAAREGIGGILALGVRQASRAIGEKAAAFAAHVKGLEMSGYDPRGAKGMGLGYATSPRGACHERAFLPQETFGAPPFIDRLTYENKGHVVRRRQDEVAVFDSLGICVFVTGPDALTLADLAELYSAVAGTTVDSDDLLACGERICNLERMFNLREGFCAADDDLPDFIKNRAVSTGPSRGQVVELEPMLAEYYRARGWSPDGRPAESQEKDVLTKTVDLYNRRDGLHG